METEKTVEFHLNVILEHTTQTNNSTKSFIPKIEHTMLQSLYIQLAEPKRRKTRHRTVCACHRLYDLFIFKLLDRSGTLDNGLFVLRVALCSRVGLPLGLSSADAIVVESIKLLATWTPDPFPHFRLLLMDVNEWP